MTKIWKGRGVLGKGKLAIGTLLFAILFVAISYSMFIENQKSKKPVETINSISASSISLHNKTNKIDKLFQNADVEILAKEVDSRISSEGPCIEIAWAYVACRLHKAGARDYSDWKQNCLDNCTDNNIKAFVSAMIK